LTITEGLTEYRCRRQDRKRHVGVIVQLRAILVAALLLVSTVAALAKRQGGGHRQAQRLTAIAPGDAITARMREQ
jgi:hypothetical protein